MPRIRQMSGTAGVALLVVALAASARSQGPADAGGGPRGADDPEKIAAIVKLLDHPAVQAEIGLGADQRARIGELKASVLKKRRAALRLGRAEAGTAARPAAAGADRGRRGEGQSAAPAAGPGTAAMAGGPHGPIRPHGPVAPDAYTITSAMRTAVAELKATSDAADAEILTRILTATQVERLTQIDLQRQGPAALLRPEVVARLDLNNDQLIAIRAARFRSIEAGNARLQAVREQLDAFRTPDGGTDQVAVEAFLAGPEGEALREQAKIDAEQLRSRTIGAIGAVLTRKQVALFNAMLGKPFDLAKRPDGAAGPAELAKKGARKATVGTPAAPRSSRTVRNPDLPIGPGGAVVPGIAPPEPEPD